MHFYAKTVPVPFRLAQATSTVCPFAHLLHPCCAALCCACAVAQQIVATGLGLQQLSLPAPQPAVAEGGVSRTQGTNAPQQELLLVSFVIEGSPAAQAGILEGDAVLSVAGQPVGGKELR